MAALRLNLRILWNHMKKFHVKHGQCDSIIFLKTFALESSKWLISNLGLAGSRILYFWQDLKSIHKFIIELHALQCLFVRGSNKKNRWVGLFQISQKERLFHVLYQPSYNLAMWSPFASLLDPSKKSLSFPFSLGKKRIHLKTQLKEEFTDLLWKLPGCSLFPWAE